MTRAARTIGTAGWLLGIAFPSWAQTYPFRALGPDDGLANPFVHALVQDASGYLWIGTGEGVARFVGTSAVMFTKADGLAEDPVSALLAAPDGAVWAGHNEGGVSRWDGSRFRAVDLHGRSGSTSQGPCSRQEPQWHRRHNGAAKKISYSFPVRLILLELSPQ